MSKQQWFDEKFVKLCKYWRRRDVKNIQFPLITADLFQLSVHVLLNLPVNLFISYLMVKYKKLHITAGYI